MKKSINYFFLFCVFTLLMLSCNTSLKVISPKVEMQKNPEGINTLTPRFSWQLHSDNQGLEQTSYQIQVALSEGDLLKQRNLVWNSNITETDKSILIPYRGAPLKSGTTYFWRVKINSNLGESNWSEIGKWSTSLLNISDWKAKWIGENKMSNPNETKKGNTRLAARYLRKTFVLENKEIKRAVLYISGIGLYKAYINSQSVTDDVFTPTQSWFSKRIYFNTYDVTQFLQNDNNVLAVKLGNGRFFGMREGQTTGLPQLIAQLEIEYQDNTTGTVISDESWKVTSKGPIIANNEFDGEEYDARLELSGWNTTSYDDSAWETPELMNTRGMLTAQPNPNISIQERFTPLSIKKTTSDRYILDMGQNMVGWLKMSLKGKKDKPIVLRFAETLKNDTTLFVENLRSAKATDIYIPASDDMFTWEPTFTYHGFRFVEISGLDYKPKTTDFVGMVFYDRMETTGSFETSSEIINQIYKNAYWGIRGNYQGAPIDCPQRDERHGWLGDRSTGCFGESFIFDNSLLYSKWIQDIQDAQHQRGSISNVAPPYWFLYKDDVTWPSTYFHVADMLYQHFGDSSLIKTHYLSMKKYLEHIKEVSMEDYILTKDEYGDWCMPPESKELIFSKDPSRQTSKSVLSTTTYYNLLNLMVKFAEISSNQMDIQAYKKLATKIKAAYNEKYFDKNTAKYDNNTVTANILSLRLGLVPSGYEKRVFDNIVKKTEKDFGGHVSTGVVGIQHLMRGLTENGNVDLAYKIATNETYPSWGYMVKKGATTIWELWNGDTADPAMNSGNHVMLLGDLLIWFYEDLAGIKNAPGSIAFKKLLMVPSFPKDLDYVKASFKSVYGEIGSSWVKKNGTFNWEIKIPGNTSAVVRIPIEIKISDIKQKGVIIKTITDEYTELELGSGIYSIDGIY